MAAIIDKRNILKFVHINFGTYQPFIVKKEISLKLIPFSGRGKAWGRINVDSNCKAWQLIECCLLNAHLEGHDKYYTINLLD